MVSFTLDLDNPAVQSYLFYSGVLSLKTFGMSILTGRARYVKNVVANEEDARLRSGTVVKFDDPDVERLRRAHLNDLENIPVFIIVGALYLTTAPKNELAVNLFRTYAAGRIIHTLVYAIKPLPQPTRFIVFGIPLGIAIFMGVKVVMHYSKAL